MRLCILHAPLDQAPLDDPDWGDANIETLKSEYLKNLLIALSNRNIERKHNGENPTPAILPGIQCGQVNLSDLTFDFDFVLDYSDFYGDLWLDSCHFEGILNLNFVTFHSIAWIRNSSFSKATTFLHSRFQSHAAFSSTVFEKYTDFSDALFFGAAHFDEAQFRDEVIFHNVKFEGKSMHFRDCIFYNAPKFQDVEFPQRTDFRGARFLEVKNEEAESAFRTLKRAMENARDHESESLFYALEKESRIYQPSTPLFEKFASICYREISDYGRNPAKPLQWLTLTIIIFFLIFLFIKSISGVLTTQSATDLFGFTMTQIVRPFYIWTSIGEETVRQQFGSYAFLGQLVATLESLCSTTILTLFLLALRRKYKLS